jgi:hypothetical protein
MALLRRVAPDSRKQIDAEAIAALAQRQNGVISRAQLLDAGVGSTTISRWLAVARLHRIHPGVYALGHTALSLDGRLIAALLYGGEEAVLSHTTAAWAWSLLDAQPTRIHITVPGRLSSLSAVCVHHSREVVATDCRGFRVTLVARTLVDLAWMVTPRQLRRVLAEADYQGLLDRDAVEASLGRGQPGSRALRAALDLHLPELARTLGVLEEGFIELCESARLPQPLVNARVGRMRVDALWRDEKLAVELDGGPAHASAAAMKRDRQRELALRAQGFQVVRYTWDQIVRHPGLVVADLRRLLSR